jgi:nucleotide-binding universal stress UspA family protein
MPEGEERGQVHRLTQILFYTDFSKNSETALKYAISATEEYDAQTTLLHVLEEVPSRAKTDDAIKTTKEQLEKLIPPGGRETLKIKTAVRIGKPYQQIIQLALETQADMVAMGVRGRGAWISRTARAGHGPSYRRYGIHRKPWFKPLAFP